MEDVQSSRPERPERTETEVGDKDYTRGIRKVQAVKRTRNQERRVKKGLEEGSERTKKGSR